MEWPVAPIKIIIQKLHTDYNSFQLYDTTLYVFRKRYCATSGYNVDDKVVGVWLGGGVTGTYRSVDWPAGTRRK